MVDLALILFILAVAAIIAVWRGKEAFDQNMAASVANRAFEPDPVIPTVVSSTTSAATTTTVRDATGRVLYTGPCSSVITVGGARSWQPWMGGDSPWGLDDEGFPAGNPNLQRKLPKNFWSTDKGVSGTTSTLGAGGGSFSDDMSWSPVGVEQDIGGRGSSLGWAEPLHHCPDGTTIINGQGRCADGSGSPDPAGNWGSVHIDNVGWMPSSKQQSGDWTPSSGGSWSMPGGGGAVPVGPAGSFSIKFMSTKNVWVDADSKRLLSMFPVGTFFTFRVGQSPQVRMRFNQSNTSQIHSILLQVQYPTSEWTPLTTDDPGSPIRYSSDKATAKATVITVADQAKVVVPPHGLPDAVDKPETESLGVFYARFWDMKNIIASGSAYSELVSTRFSSLDKKTIGRWMYFRVGSSGGGAVAQKNSPFFRMRLRPDTKQPTAAGTTQGIEVEQYSLASDSWKPVVSPVPSLAMSKTATGPVNVLIELKPSWRPVGDKNRGKVPEGGALPVQKRISDRFIPVGAFEGEGDKRYQKVYDDITMQYGKYYLKTKRFELPGAKSPANLRCPPGRKMRKNTSCSPK